ncbi:hypothetical protein BD413DRAFT_94250 [Trametes elegans]|nr:hypothetical protein BD413DRAFT_94250 [Trametes elegans]
MRSWRYMHSPSAWLIAGSGDVISVRHVTSASLKDKFNYDLYTLFMKEQHAQRALYTTQKGGVTSDDETPLATFPPFTDAEIHRYTESDPDAYPYRWQCLHSQGEMEALMKRGWTAPMRIGSQVAKVCLEIVRKDIARTAMEEVNSWDMMSSMFGARDDLLLTLWSAFRSEIAAFVQPSCCIRSWRRGRTRSRPTIYTRSRARSVPISAGSRFGLVQSDAETERFEELNAKLGHLILLDEEQEME